MLVMHDAGVTRAPGGGGIRSKAVFGDRSTISRIGDLEDRHAMPHQRNPLCWVAGEFR
jgi:hypothetical protein